MPLPWRAGGRPEMLRAPQAPRRAGAPQGTGPRPPRLRRAVGPGRPGLVEKQPVASVRP